MCACFAIVITSSGAKLLRRYDATAPLRVIRLNAHDLSVTTPLGYGHFYRMLTSAHTIRMMTRDDRALPASGSCNKRGSNIMPRNPLAPLLECIVLLTAEDQMKKAGT